MNPQYRFFLQIDSIRKQAYPIYDDSLSKNYSKESGQAFFRAELDGKLKFVRSDYDFIMSSAFDSIVYVELEISGNRGVSWSNYFKGQFMRTDCSIDPDNKIIEVSLTPNDKYEDIIAGLDKEFNLIELAPEIKKVGMTKRPAIQIYAAGDSVVTSFVGGTYFEQNSSQVADKYTLENTYKFGSCGYVREFSIKDIGQGSDEEIIGTYIGFQKDENIVLSDSLNQVYTKFNNKDIQLEVIGGDLTINFMVRKISTNEVIAATALTTATGGDYDGHSYPISAKSGVELYDMYYVQTPLFARVLTNMSSIEGVTLYDLPLEDILDNSMNYAKVYPYVTRAFAISTYYSAIPTEYGIIQPGMYFTKPAEYSNETLYPVSRSQWINASIWFRPAEVYSLIDTPNRYEYTLRHAYPLLSCIYKLTDAIIGQNIQGVYSKFFEQPARYNYVNPVSSIAFEVLLTQKTNILKGEYDQPAQKAMITLKQILDMLKNCFQCYWYLAEEDDGVYMYIEHISYFQNGMRYPGWDGVANVGYDLTKFAHPRSYVPWSYGVSAYSFEKENMPSWYQFEWSDDVTLPFKGYPIEVLSNYTKKDNTETISVNKFVSDVDLMLLNPSAFSEDGLALLIAQKTNLLGKTIAFSTSSDEMSSVIELKKRIAYKTNINVGGYSSTGDAYYRLTFLNAEGTALGKSSLSNAVSYLGGNFVISGTVPPETEKIQIECLNSSGSSISSRGYLYTFTTDDEISLPIISKTIGNDEFNMQNGYAAFCDLQERYYLKSLPAPKVVINKTQRTVIPTRNKKQVVEFPTGYSDPNVYSLVRTNLGDGQISDIKINLSSRLAKVTLMHDTE